ncbi:MAG TPA: TonB-dependent receptor [Longimicrobium sp.]|jgi:outer membrane receptor protein involved in Fe transport|uniref:TonB-dependent receptor domain-containing protein n=1 Tax=Longimicrobium sp. TaxID=2029185 RepID=UPI002EDB8B8A
MNALGRSLLALTLAAAVPAAAQTRPAGPPPAGGAPGGMRPGGAPGQQQGGVLLGTVTDPAGKPLGSAQVAVWSAADSTLVTGAVTRGNGAFRVDGLRPGSYFVKVSSLGFATATSAVVAVTPQAREANLGTIRMNEGALLLEGVTVSAERQTTGMAADRNTYRAADLPTAGGSAVDVLRNIPAVEVDQDGRVSLRGNQNVAVQVNGRPTPMRGDQLAAFLQQLPANVVENVEVIPNPSAKYEPEGMAGIVNIVLKQNADLGLSYGLQAGVGTGGRFNGSGNVGYQAGALTLFGNYGLRRDERQNRGFNTISAYSDSISRQLDYVTDQRNGGEFNMQSHLFNGSADLRLGARDVLSTSVLLSRGAFDAEADNRYVRRDAAGGLVQETRGLTDNENSDFTADGSLSFKHTVQPQQNELSAELRFNRSRNELSSRTAEGLLGGSAGTVGDVFTGQENEAVTRNLTLQADYTRPLAGFKLETGYKGTLRMLDNEQAILGIGPADGEVVVGRSAFDYDENVNAGYAVLSRGFGGLQTQAGLRGEYTSRDFSLGTGESYPRDYWSWFPSGLVALNLDDQRQVRLSYSRRIQRPDTRMLNPFSFSEDPRNRSTGNPDLEPEYTHALEMGYQHSFGTGSVQVTPFFRRTENVIRRIREVRGDTLLVSFRNLDTNDSYGLDLNTSVRRGKVNGFASFSAFRTVTDAGSVGEELSSDAIGWSARMSGTYQVTPRLDVQGMLFYRAPMDVEQGRMGSMVMSSFSVRQKLMGERASLSLRVQDPLNRMGFSMSTHAPLYDQFSERRFGGRAAYLTFSYNYGQTPRLRQRPQQQDQEMQPPTVVGP